MGRLIRQLRDSPFVRDVTTLLTGTVLAQLLPIAIAPLLTRLYAPESFGLFAIYLSVINVTAVAATGRYETAVPLPASERDSAAILLLALLASTATSLLSLLLVLAAGPAINRILGISGDNALVYLLPFGILGAALFRSLSYWVIFRARFQRLAAGKMAWSGGISGAQLALAPLLHQAGLLLGQIVGQLAGAATLFLGAVRRDLPLFRATRRDRILRVAGGYRNFPLISMPAALINSLANQLPLVLLGLYFGPAVAGLFALTQRVLGAPIALLAVSVQEVFKERAARDLRDTGSCRPIFVKTLASLALLAAPPFALLLLVAPELFAWLFGERWREAGEFARLLTGLYYMRFVSSPLSYVLYIAEKQKQDFAWQLVLLLVTTGSLIVGGASGSARLGIGLFAAAYATMYAIYLILSYRASIRR